MWWLCVYCLGQRRPLPTPWPVEVRQRWPSIVSSTNYFGLGYVSVSCRCGVASALRQESHIRSWLSRPTSTTTWHLLCRGWAVLWLRARTGGHRASRWPWGAEPHCPSPVKNRPWASCPSPFPLAWVGWRLPRGSTCTVVRKCMCRFRQIVGRPVGAWQVRVTRVCWWPPR